MLISLKQSKWLYILEKLFYIDIGIWRLRG